MMILLNKQAILDRSPSPIHIDIFDEMDSTNDYLKTFIPENNTLRICLAEKQTQGKGQFNRTWHSPAHDNLYFSLLYPTPTPIHQLSGLSLMIGLSTARAIEEIICMDHKFMIKWPNDILFEQQKIAGILIESQVSNGLTQLVIGIGINVNMQQATDVNIDQAWSSLKTISGQYIDRNLLCASLIRHLLTDLACFIQYNGLTSFMGEWKTRDYLFGKPVKNGVAAGINLQGQLLVKSYT